MCEAQEEALRCETCIWMVEYRHHPGSSLAEEHRAGVIAALNKRVFCTGEDDAGLLEELQRLPRKLCDAWEIFSGEELFDFLGEPVEL